MSGDGLNTFQPEYQKGEFFAGLPEDVRECLEAYGCKSYVDMLGSNDKPGPWYPMYSHSDMLTRQTEAGRAWKEMNAVKHRYLPQVIMTEDFEKMWEQYMTEYRACLPELFFEEMQRELERRIKTAED